MAVLAIAAAQPADIGAKIKVAGGLSEKINSIPPGENIRVIIILKKSAGYFQTQAARSSVRGNILARGGEIRREYSIFEGIAAELPASKIVALASNPYVELIVEDRVVRAFLKESVPLINADDVWNKRQFGQNVTGAGQTACVIDTGVDYNHPDLGGGKGPGFKVLGGYDFANNDDDPMDDVGHGTHVAGIIAANGTLKGVAPDANIVAMKVLGASGSGLSSDVLAGIDWCVGNAATYNITIISMSLGGHPYNTYCDNEAAETGFRDSINAAIAKNITVVVATGNDAKTMAIATPACIQNATRVGATYDAKFGKMSWGTPVTCTDDMPAVDKITCFTNRGANFPDILLAPGALTKSMWLSNGYKNAGGTSMAAPHVSGMIALLNQRYKTIHATNPTPKYLFNITNSTGVPIYDSKTGKTYSRIDALAAYNAIDPTPPSLFFVGPTPQNNANLSRSYVFINVTASETLRTALLERGGANETMNFSGSWYLNKTVPVDGTYTFKVWGSDLGGNWNVTETRVVNIDTTAPTITIHSPANTIVNGNTLLLNVTFGEPINTAWYNNGTADSAHYYGISNLTQDLMNLEDGPYNVTVYANDSFGNLNYSRVYFTVDSNPPEINITNPVNGTTIKVFNSTVRGSIFDTVFMFNKVNITGNGVGPVEVNVTDGEFSYDISYVNGSNTIFVNATDGGSHIGSASITVTVIKELQWDVSTANESGTFMWDVNAGYMDTLINLSTGNQQVNGTMKLTVHALAADASSSVVDANTGSWGTHLGKFIDINVSDNLNETSGNMTWAEIRVYYLQEEVSKAKLTESSLALYWDNGTTWKKLDTGLNWINDTGVNMTDMGEYSGYVWANLSHFSTYSVAGRYWADLGVKSITFSDSSPTDGDVITINATVQNTNATDADNFTVELLVDGVSMANGTLSVKNNSTNITELSWTSTSGTHNITIVADAGEGISEVNETNNNRPEQITVKTKADLTSDSITFSESGPMEGDLITINATVRNNGETDAIGFNISFLMDGTSQTTNALSVEAGSVKSTLFTWTSIKGTHNITIAADVGNIIDESNEANNNETEQITIKAKSSPPSGGGGGGGGGAATSYEVRILDIQAGQAVDQDMDDDDVPYLKGISLTLTHDTYSSRFSVTDLKKKPWSSMADPDAQVYRYFKAKYDKKNYVESAVFEFRVPRSWLKENNIDPDTVKMYRYTTKWNKLPTKFVEEDDEWVYFKAETPGFSYFSIGGAESSGYIPAAAVEKKAAVEVSMLTEPPVKVKVQKTPTPKSNVTSPPPTELPSEEKKKGVCGPTAVVLLAVLPRVFRRKVKVG